MSTRSAYVAWCLLIASLQAQSAVLRTATDVVAETGILGGLRDVIPANTIVSVQRTVLSAMANQVANLAASASITPASPRAFAVRADVSGVLWDSQAAGYALTSGTLDWQLQGPTRGWLTLGFRGANSGTLASSSARLDLTAPGIREGFHIHPGNGLPVDRNVRRFISVPASFTLRTDFAVDLQPRSQNVMLVANLDLQVSFEPALPPVRQVPFGTSCGLDVVVVDDTTVAAHVVSVRVSSAFPSRPVVHVFGFQRAALPLPPCTVWVDPVAALVQVADAVGNTAMMFQLPGPLQGVPFVMQSISIGGAAAIRAGAGLELQFVD